MAKYLDFKETKNFDYTYVLDDEDEKFKETIIKIDKKNKKIYITTKDNNFCKKMVIEGHTDLPDIFNEWGKIKSGSSYFLSKKLSGYKIQDFVVSEKKGTSSKKVKAGFNVTCNLSELESLKSGLDVLINKSKVEKNQFVEGFLSDKLPNLFQKKVSFVGSKKSILVKSLDKEIIKDFSQEEINTFTDFYTELIKTRYTSKDHKTKLMQNSKLKIDTIALDEVIKEFESLLEEDPPEAKWGKFLKKYLFLVDSKYINSIPELNLVLAGSRKVDFGLIDTAGFLDIFEIKKSSTPLLAGTTDRGNHFFNTQLVKAVTQAEKYLFNAERKGTALKEDIKSEYNIDVDIIKPRAIILAGDSSQLNTENKKKDFRILRSSLKNIEIILFDELLERLKRQRNKVYEL